MSKSPERAKDEITTVKENLSTEVGGYIQSIKLAVVSGTHETKKLSPDQFDAIDTGLKAANENRAPDSLAA